MNKLKPSCPNCHNIDIIEIDETTAINLGYHFNILNNKPSDNCEKNYYKCKTCGNVFGAVRSST